MMIVKVDENSTYKVDFERVREEVRKKRRVTLCKLYFDTGLEQPRKWDLIGIEKTKCSRKDNFCKETGRKIALTRILANWFPGPSHKEIRFKFWEAYFNRFPEIPEEEETLEDLVGQIDESNKQPLIEI